MKLRIAFCYNNYDTASGELLIKIISEIFTCRGYHNHICCYKNGMELLRSGERYDLIFLDVHNPENCRQEISDFLYCRRISTFTIAFSENEEDWKRGYRIGAFGFVPRATGKRQLEEVIGLLIQKLERGRIIVSTRDKKYLMLKRDIIFVESIKNERGVVVHTKNRSYIDMRSMREYAQKLKEECFFQSHRCYIINLNHVLDFDSDNIYMINGSKVYISCKKKKEFVAFFEEFVIKKCSHLDHAI